MESESSQIQYNQMVTQKETRDLWGVGLSKKPKDLSPSEREECGYGEGVSTEDVRESALWYDVVCSRKETRYL